MAHMHNGYTDVKLPLKFCNTRLERTYSLSINTWNSGQFNGQITCCFCSLLTKHSSQILFYVRNCTLPHHPLKDDSTSESPGCMLYSYYLAIQLLGIIVMSPLLFSPLGKAFLKNNFFTVFSFWYAMNTGNITYTTLN